MSPKNEKVRFVQIRKMMSGFMGPGDPIETERSQERPVDWDYSCYYFRSICLFRNPHKYRGLAQICNRC
jgi:hypothetical protein